MNALESACSHKMAVMAAFSPQLRRLLRDIPNKNSSEDKEIRFHSLRVGTAVTLLSTRVMGLTGAAGLAGRVGLTGAGSTGGVGSTGAMGLTGATGFTSTFGEIVTVLLEEPPRPSDISYVMLVASDSFDLKEKLITPDAETSTVPPETGMLCDVPGFTGVPLMLVTCRTSESGSVSFVSRLRLSESPTMV